MEDEKDAPASEGEFAPVAGLVGDGLHDDAPAVSVALAGPGYLPPEAAVPESPIDPARAPEPQDDGIAARVDRAIAAWMAEHIHNSPVSRDTEVINHLTGRLAELRRMICQEIGQ